jgi:hypothetical protein
VELALAQPRIEAWLDRYPADPTTHADFRSDSRTWLVKVWSGGGSDGATGRVGDGAGS